MSLRQLIVEVASALGISTLKSQQSEAIFQFLHGRDVFVALPTGYGKSLCYMALPWIFDRLRGVTNQSVVLVVSPLVVWYPAPSVQAHARIRITACACGKEGSGEMVVSAPDPHVTPSRKRVWYLTSECLVVLSQHVRKTGNPIRSLDLKLSCDIKEAR